MTWFVDGGAHRGESARLARKVYTGGALLIVAIEPAAECWRDLAAEGVLIVPAALWTSVGFAPFYRGTHEVSSTLIAEKKTGGISLACHERVPTVTLGSIVAAVPTGEKLVVKLDVEGAEYAILEQAIDEGALLRVDEIYVDFHGDRITGFVKDRHNQLVRRLLLMGHSLPKWCPVDGTVYPWGERWLLT